MSPFVERLHAAFTATRPIDADTSFFEAGFTSKALVDVLARLQDLGLDMELVDLYRFPTVRGLAEEIGRRTAADGEPAARSGLPWASG